MTKPDDLDFLELAAPVGSLSDGEAGFELGFCIHDKHKCLRGMAAAFAFVGCLAVPVFACGTDFGCGMGGGLAHDGGLE